MGCNANGSDKYTGNVHANNEYLFVDMLDEGIVVFPDNILIYSITSEEHFKLLEKVFTCLHKHAFYCKLKKCSFLCKTTSFLGFDITPDGMCISNAKVQSLKK